MNEAQAFAALTTGIAQMNLVVSPQAVQKLTQYAFLLAKWSQVYNLTTVRAVEDIIPVHILDSLTVLSCVHNIKHVLDVGTGAGLPGIPLAIIKDDVQFTLLDSQQKKITFLQHVITMLQLKNVTATQQRIEKLQVSCHFDMVVARAFASLDEFVKLIMHTCDHHTKIVAMKAKDDVVSQELQLLPPGFELVNIEKVAVPGVNAPRCLVFLRKI